MLAHLHYFIATPIKRLADARLIFWLSLSLTISLVYSLLALQIALSSDYIVQDDARQYVFWMQRFVDPSLFPNDLIADYFQSVSPLGYETLYRTAAMLGIHPFLLNKLLPVALSLLTTVFSFALTLQIVPIPFTAFVASLLLNQTLWMKDDLVSASPRSFVYPLFLAFLLGLSWYQSPPGEPRSPWKGLMLSVGAIALLGLFYPQYLLVSAGVLLLTLVRWQQGRMQVSRRRQDYVYVGLHLAVILVLLLSFALGTSAFDPVVTAAQARAMPEFWPKGRNFFFNENLWWFYGVGDRSGYLHVGLVRPATLVLSLFLPILYRFPSRFQVLNQITPQIWLLLRLWISGTVLFVLAHLLLFRLHLPARYTDHSLRIITAIAAAIVLTAVLDAVIRAHGRSPSASAPPARRSRPLLAWSLVGAVAALLLLYPLAVEDFPLTKYKTGNTPKIYAFFAQQPTDTLVASVDEEVNNIPVFSQKSILVGREFAIPYHLGYYQPFKQRALDLIRAQYTGDRAELQAFIRTYGVDFWIVDEEAFDPDYITDIWTRQYATEVASTLDTLEAGEVPALKRLRKRCSVLRENGLEVLDAACILEAP